MTTLKISCTLETLYQKRERNMNKREAMEGGRKKGTNYIERSVRTYILGQVLSLGVAETGWWPQNMKEFRVPQHVAGQRLPRESSDR